MKQTLVSFNRNSSINNLIPTDSRLPDLPNTVYATKIHTVNCCQLQFPVRLPFFSCHISYHLASKGRAVKGKENRKFLMKEARTTSGSLTGRIREVV